MVSLEKPKEHAQICPQPFQDSLAIAWFFLMDRHFTEIVLRTLAQALPCKDSSVLLFSYMKLIALLDSLNKILGL